MGWDEQLRKYLGKVMESAFGEFSPVQFPTLKNSPLDTVQPQRPEVPPELETAQAISGKPWVEPGAVIPTKSGYGAFMVNDNKNAVDYDEWKARSEIPSKPAIIDISRAAGILGARTVPAGEQYGDWIAKTNSTLAEFRGSSGRMSPGRAAQEKKRMSLLDKINESKERVAEFQAGGADLEAVRTAQIKEQNAINEDARKRSSQVRETAIKQRANSMMAEMLKKWRAGGPVKDQLEKNYPGLFEQLDKGIDAKDSIDYQHLVSSMELAARIEMEKNAAGL